MRKQTEKTRILCRAGVLCAVLCVLSVLSFPIGAIPFSCALAGVFLCGAFLPPVYAFGAVLVYLAAGGMGLPVFSGMRGGIDVLLGITGGYLWGYPLTALCTAFGFSSASRRGFQKPYAVSVCGFVGSMLGLALCYLFGTLRFCRMTGNPPEAAFLVCVLPFLPFDIAKALIALFLRFCLRKRL